MTLFNVGVLVGLIASALAIAWIVTDCQDLSPTRTCNVSFVPNWQGMLHFAPVQP